MFRSMILLASVLLVACGKQEKPMAWVLEESMSLEQVNPIGITSNDEGIWLSDGDRNRLVLLDQDGRVIRSVDSLDRPMHISGQGNELIVPTYGNDQVLRLQREKLSALALKDSLDAPAGADVRGPELAIADFYNHRILYTADGKDYLSFGSEGKGEGEFYYPTDVQLTEDKIWVADAYNNRVQVFDKNGQFLQVIGADQKINAALGLYVTEKELILADFESDRVLVFDHQGQLKQELEESIQKPTDVLVYQDQLYVANYKSGTLNRYVLQEVTSTQE